MPGPNCKARREQDEMVCRACALRWAVDDEEPPPCGNEGDSVDPLS